MNISRSAHWKLKPCIGKLEGVKAVSELCRLSPERLGTVRKDSPKLVPAPLPDRRIRGASRRRSACARPACTIHETSRAHRTHPGPALMSGSSMHLDVLPCGGRPHSCLRGAADGAAGQLGALAVDLRRPIRVALVHRANLLTTAARQDAKRPVWSKP